ncbi:unnamed protein product [Effrenium voratum]|nr:unnamed protein product [Effrenium voratum]
MRKRRLRSWQAVLFVAASVLCLSFAFVVTTGDGRKVRPYQREAVNYFFAHAEKAARQGRHLKFQMACGTGKTFTYALIIARDMAENPDGRYVIFVPWRDLARQTAEELRRFGVSCCVVGDGSRDLDATSSVVVCVYASAHLLRGRSFRIKIVDEAHHIEMKGKSGYSGIIKHGISSELAAHFTATFYLSDQIDFRYDLERALDEGHVCDFMITVPVGNTQDIEAMGEWIRTNRERLTPMLVVSNRVKRARECAEKLTSLGVRCRDVCGNMNHSTRQQLKQDLKEGRLDALCVVNIFNEGTSIDELKSVVFLDKRQSSLNVKQLAMRVTRLHETKVLANVVLPMSGDAAYDRDIATIIRSLAEIKPQLRSFIQQKSMEWFNFVDLRHGSSTLCRMEWDAVASEYFDRFGRYLGGRGMEAFEVRVGRLAAFVERWNHLPRWNPKEPKEEENPLACFLKYIRQRLRTEALSEQDLQLLQAVPLMAERMASWEDPVEHNMDWSDRCSLLARFQAQHRRLPGPKNGEQERYLYYWLTEVGRSFRSGKLSEDQIEALEKVPGMRKKMQRWDLSRLKLQVQQMDWSQGCKELEEWLQVEDRMPRESGNHSEQILGLWLRGARSAFITGNLTELQVQQLRAGRGMLEQTLRWEIHYGPEESWMQHCRQIEQLPAKAIAMADEDVMDEELAIWLRIACLKYQKRTLSAAQRAALERIPQLCQRLQSLRKKPPKPPSEQWAERLADFAAWQKAHQRLPKMSGDLPEKSLAHWLAKNKRLYTSGRLSPQQIDALRQIPGVFERLNPIRPIPIFEDHLTRIELWRKQHGSLPSAGADSQDHERYLSRTLRRQMDRHLDGKLLPEESAALLKVTGVSELLEERKKYLRRWQQRLQQLSEWLSENGDLLENWTKFSTEEPHLMAWLANQRLRFLAIPSQISTKELSQLQALPGFESYWMKWLKLKELVVFRKRCEFAQHWADQHHELPASEDDVETDALASGVFQTAAEFVDWVQGTLSKMQAKRLDQNQRAILRNHPYFAEKMPTQITEENYDSFWQKRFRQLKRWVAVAGRLPSIYRRRPMEAKLGWWVDHARKAFARKKLDQEQVDQLQSIPGMAHRLRRRVKPSNWEDGYASVQAWVAAHGRLPKSQDNEKQLATWLSNSCASARRGEMPPERLVKLKQIPHLRERLIQSNGCGPGVWPQRLQLLGHWLSTKKRTPSLRGAGEELKLARWLHCSLVNAVDGDLQPKKLSELQAALGDFWDDLYDQTAIDSWETNFESLTRWLETNGPPKLSAGAREERRLAFWLKRTRAKAKRGELPEEFAAKLLQIP